MAPTTNPKRKRGDPAPLPNPPEPESGAGLSPAFLPALQAAGDYRAAPPTGEVVDAADCTASYWQGEKKEDSAESSDEEELEREEESESEDDPKDPDTGLFYGYSVGPPTSIATVAGKLLLLKREHEGLYSQTSDYRKQTDFKSIRKAMEEVGAHLRDCERDQEMTNEDHKLMTEKMAAIKSAIEDYERKAAEGGGQQVDGAEDSKKKGKQPAKD